MPSFFAAIATGLSRKSLVTMGTGTGVGSSSWDTRMSIELNSATDRGIRGVGEIPWRKRENHYKVLNNIGKGSFGQVVSAVVLKSNKSILLPEAHKVGTLMEPLKDSTYRVHTLVAIKIMKKQMSNYSRVKEVRCINAIPSHPGLVQIFDIFVDSTSGQLHIVMESMNQNLYQLMTHRKHTQFSSDTLKSILTQLLSAIRHIHRHDYFHRDVKPENILVIPSFQYYGDKSNIPPYREKDSYIIKLADYGLARHINDQRVYTEYVATRWYRSPEILLRKKWYSKPCDIWAFGTIAVELANVSPLFPGKNELDQIGRILSVLGNPTPPSTFYDSCNDYKIPLGGFWKEAAPLSTSLGIELLHTDGVEINDIIPIEVHHELADVAKACLTWDPVIRADVETLCSMSYFKDTSLASKYVEPERVVTKSDPKLLSNFIGLRKGHLLDKLQYNSSGIFNRKSSKFFNTQRQGNLEENKPLRIFDDIDDGYEYEFQGCSSINKDSNAHHYYDLGEESNAPIHDNFEVANSDESDCNSSGVRNDPDIDEMDGAENERLLSNTIDNHEEDNLSASVSSSAIREYLAAPSGNVNYTYSFSETDKIDFGDFEQPAEFWGVNDPTDPHILHYVRENDYDRIGLLSGLGKNLEMSHESRIHNVNSRPTGYNKV